MARVSLVTIFALVPIIGENRKLKAIFFLEKNVRKDLVNCFGLENNMLDKTRFTLSSLIKEVYR